MRLKVRAAALILAAALSASSGAVVLAAQARQGRTAARGAATIPQTWLSKLNLTADQQSKLQAANDSYRADLEKARAVTSPDERRTATRQARQAYQAALQAVLTPEQQEKLQAMRTEARDYRELGAIGNQLAGLNLTSEQKEKLKGIAEKYRPKLQELRTSLQSAADKQPVRDQMRDLRRQMTDEVKAVLTPDQVAQLQPAAALQSPRPSTSAGR